jgi:hypothetical protein
LTNPFPNSGLNASTVAARTQTMSKGWSMNARWGPR